MQLGQSRSLHGSFVLPPTLFAETCSGSHWQARQSRNTFLRSFHAHFHRTPLLLCNLCTIVVAMTGAYTALTVGQQLDHVGGCLVSTGKTHHGVGMSTGTGVPGWYRHGHYGDKWFRS